METPACRRGGPAKRAAGLPPARHPHVGRVPAGRATGVLSQRWRDVWRSVRCIDIDQRELCRAGGEEGALVVVEDYDGFEDFANALLSPTLLGGTSTAAAGRFRLHLLYEGRFISFGRWVHRALKRPPPLPALVDIHIEYGSTLD
ncbi:hypothetical protein E2562_018234 [Oryza meyeriana var. granulata]|uniref:Uncharacterized protein n=1 Tax=Oryza meyeriana var. granulata TaxID=110450 RepID=A0A6G1CGT0_9ORYZ|nr:hypothetical protein E2562_018234 [Oryza meyeriana var. granulata]